MASDLGAVRSKGAHNVIGTDFLLSRDCPHYSPAGRRTSTWLSARLYGRADIRSHGPDKEPAKFRKEQSSIRSCDASNFASVDESDQNHMVVDIAAIARTPSGMSSRTFSANRRPRQIRRLGTDPAERHDISQRASASTGRIHGSVCGPGLSWQSYGKCRCPCHSDPLILCYLTFLRFRGPAPTASNRNNVPPAASRNLDRAESHKGHINARSPISTSPGSMSGGSIACPCRQLLLSGDYTNYGEWQHGSGQLVKWRFVASRHP